MIARCLGQQYTGNMKKVAEKKESDFDKLAHTVLGGFAEMREEMNMRFDELGERFEKRFEAIEHRLTQIEYKMDQMSMSIDSIRREIYEIKVRLDRLEEAVEGQKGYAKEIDWLRSECKRLEAIVTQKLQTV